MSEEKAETFISNESEKKMKRKYLFLDKFNNYANEMDYSIKKMKSFNYWHGAVTIIILALVIYCITSH